MIVAITVLKNTINHTVRQFLGKSILIVSFFFNKYTFIKHIFSEITYQKASLMVFHLAIFHKLFHLFLG